MHIKINKKAASVCGTSAHLVENDILSIEQLLYGMMLPSGNDAAYALAEYFGQILYNSKFEKVAHMFACPYNSHFINSSIKYFLYEMNQLVKKLKMGGTFYDSPHGLSNKLNYSCAEDQAFLVTECMKIDIFRKVVGQK